MLRPLAVVVGVIALSSAGGCGRDDAPSAKTSSQPATTAQPETLDRPGERDVDVQGAPEGSSQPGTTPAGQATAAPATKAVDRRANEADAAERIAILTPGGPLVVDVRLTIDGRPHTEVFEANVKQVLDAGDTDDDDKATWREIVENEKFVKERLGNMPLTSGRQKKTFIERYDENRDGAIQRGEVASLLGREAGASARAFAVRSSRSYLPVPRATSQVWQLLDGDRNGRLSADEIEQSAVRFFLLDADDDRVIAPPELASLREQLEAAAQRAPSVSREASRYAVLHLEPGFETDRLEYLLSDLYAPRQNLAPTSFPALARLYGEIDANGDQWLEQAELAKLMKTDPHLKLTILFESSKGQEQRAANVATLSVGDHISEIDIIAQPTADRVVLGLDNSKLIVSVHDLAAGPNTNEGGGQSEQRGQIRLMAHDQCDALFEGIDSNADGRLGEREIASCPELLMRYDANADGQVASDELPYAMIIAFLRGERPGEQSFYVPMYSSAATGDVQTPPWFLHADLNSDGDISRREFLGTPKHFSQLDTNQDGYIAAAEAATIQSN